MWLVVRSHGSEQPGSESDEEMKSGSEHRWTSAAGDTSAATGENGGLEGDSDGEEEDRDEGEEKRRMLDRRRAVWRS